MHHPGRIRSDRWRAIARACRDEPRTVPAIARELEVPAGSIQSLIGTMRREGLLEEAASDARGTALRLTRRGRAELARREHPGGVESLLPAGERLVFVLDEGRGLRPDVLAELAADPSFRWAVRLDGTVRWIASFGAGDAVAADRAVNALVAAGARAVPGRADALYDPAGLAELAARSGAATRRAIGAS